MTKILTLLSALLGGGSVVAALSGDSSLAAALLGAVATTISLLVYSVARDIRRAQNEASSLLQSELGALQKSTALVVRGNRTVIRESVRQADRVETQVAANLKRVIGDISTLRLEVADAAKSSTQQGSQQAP